MKTSEQIISFIDTKLKYEMYISEPHYTREEFYDSLERRKLLEEILEYINNEEKYSCTVFERPKSSLEFGIFDAKGSYEMRLLMKKTLDEFIKDKEGSGNS